MTESRKRPFSDDEDALLSTKKRATTVSRNGSPQLNGVSEEDESSGMDNVELFRKEAIFRRMRHYAREFERSQSQILELEQRKKTSELGLAAISACWTQLVETIKPLIQSQQVLQLTSGLLDFQMQIGDDWEETYQQALEAKLGATRHLVHSLIKQGNQKPAVPPSVEEREKLAGECAALKAQLNVTNGTLKSLTEEKETLHKALLAAENRLARQRSSTIQAMETRAAAQQNSTQEAEAETQGKPSSPRDQKPSGGANGVINQFEFDALRDSVQTREKKLVKAESKIAALEQQLAISKATIESQELAEQVIQRQKPYTDLLQHARLLYHALSETQRQLSANANELAAFQMTRQAWEKETLANASKTINELKGMLQKRDDENARLRDQREQQAAELLERRQEAKDSLHVLPELKKLTQSQAERIIALQLEAGRYKSALAANAGHRDLSQFLLNAKGDEADYIVTLESRLKAAEGRATALEQAISALDSKNPDLPGLVKSQAAAVDRLRIIEEELAKYKSAFGEASSASDLAGQLRSKEEMIQQLNQTESSLFSEVDRLSSAYDLLENQISKKLLETVDFDERIKRLSMSKAKSDNKYFAVMREKTEGDLACKNALLNAEKQSQTVQLLQAQRNHLEEQVKTLQSETSQLNALTISYKSRADDLEGKLRITESEKAALRTGHQNLLNAMREHEQKYQTKLEALRQTEDNLNRTRREIEQRQKDIEVLRGKGDDDDENEALSVLMCVCRKRIRNTIITKCMHTFCKECVDARIATRQRRCPSCNLGFAQSEVQPLWFQQ